jgi:formate hydrogenlyase transcriptional activator
VDDDLSVREGVESLIRSAGLRAETFASAQEFLARPRSGAPSCLVLDVEMPGLSGLDLQAELAKADVRIPIIFLTGHGNIPMTVRAIKAGALEFLTKPFDDEDLLGAIRQCVDRYHTPRQPQNLEQHSYEGIIGTSAALQTALKQERAEHELRQSEADLRTKNDRLKLLLNVTNQITSNPKLREMLRSISSNIREVMHCDAVFVSLVDSASGTPRLYVLDFPQSKGLIKEETVYTISGAGKRVLETLKPSVVDVSDPAAVPPEIYNKVVAEGLKSACLIPLVNRGRALGGLVIARRTETSFTPEDVEFLSQASGQIAIAIANALAYHEISDLKDKLAQEKLYLEEEICSEMNFENIVGNSPALKHVLELVETVAPNDSTVLLLGETGTGKELIARAIHERSRRRECTFVRLNCAAIPTGLLESELFGHEKGAFTGAIAQKVGRMELADQGTLFLDEVGDIPIEIQPKLLRALQEREFERLGSNRTRKANVRLVAATNRELEKMIAAREFRSDLYYRLNVFPIRIPPLRERREDIPLLVSYFVQKFSRQMKKNIDSVPNTALKTLSSWNWPGNIRELENFIERAVILTRGKSLDAPLSELREPNVTLAAVDSRDSSGHDDVVRIVREAIEGLHKATPNGDRPQKDLPKRDREEEKENRRSEIMHLLHETRGRVGGADGAAARMGINRTTLLSRMKRLGIHANEF